MRISIWLAMASAFALSGCAFFIQDRVHYTWTPDSAAPCESCVPAPSGARVIGVALSGGGSRASVYGAAALEVLDEEGLLDQMTYLSSVSGGGFPAAYYALKKPAACAAVDTACDGADFAAFKQAMRQDFLVSMTLRQIAKPNRISSPTRRLSSLQDVLDEAIIGEATFADLPASPVLLINAARYDDGRRFVFSNLPIAEAESEIRQFSHETLRTASFSQPGCTRPTPKDFSVALATAISAGFPPFLGPAAIKMPITCEGGGTHYWHLGDGGILDNSGVETIEDYALRAAAEDDAAKHVVIFSVDAGRTSTTEAMMQRRNLKLWTTDPGRVVDIVTKRARAYREVALRELAAETGVQFTVIKMRYTDAQIEQWPVSCRGQDGGSEAIRAHLHTIPTNLQISECDADLMELAAQDVVRRAIQDNRSLLDAALMR